MRGNIGVVVLVLLIGGCGLSGTGSAPGLIDSDASAPDAGGGAGSAWSTDEADAAWTGDSSRPDLDWGSLDLGKGDPDTGFVGDATDPTDATDATDPKDPTPDEPTGAIEKTFRVLHWNIAGGKENNCNTAGITAAVKSYVKDKNVDFVGLNEVCPAQYASIREALRGLWGKGANAKFSAYVGDVTGRIVGNAIYSRHNLHDVTKQKVGADQYGDRNLICAKINPYEHLRFCSVHLTPGDTKAREQMGRVKQRIEGWWANRGDTVILSGDINLQANDRGLNGIYSSGANHPQNNPNNNGRYREVDDADPQHCQGFGERSLPGTSGGPCSAGGKIDFIFARENRIIDYNGDTLNIPSTCGGVCSDHRAVFGRLKLKIKRN